MELISHNQWRKERDSQSQPSVFCRSVDTGQVMNNMEFHCNAPHRCQHHSNDNAPLHIRSCYDREIYHKQRTKYGFDFNQIDIDVRTVQ